MSHDRKMPNGFMTRRRVLELTGQSLLLTSTRSWAFAQLGMGTQVKRQATPQGEITGASYQQAANNVQMSISRRNANLENVAEITFSKNAQPLLRMVAELSRSSTPKALGEAKLTAEGNGVNYGYLLDARAVALDKPHVLPTGRAKVHITNKGQVWNGEFDFKAWKYLGLDNAPHLDHALPDEIKRVLDPFRPTLETARTFYWSKLRQKGVMPLRQDTPPLEFGSVFGPGGRGFPGNPCMEACTIVADAAYAACVAGTVVETAGLGILACEVIWVAAFAACMEVC